MKGFQVCDIDQINQMMDSHSDSLAITIATAGRLTGKAKPPKKIPIVKVKKIPVVKVKKIPVVKVKKIPVVKVKRIPLTPEQKREKNRLRNANYQLANHTAITEKRRLKRQVITVATIDEAGVIKLPKNRLGVSPEELVARAKENYHAEKALKEKQQPEVAKNEVQTSKKK